MGAFPKSKATLKRLCRQIRKGDRLYAVVEISQRVAPWEPPRMYAVYTCTGLHPILCGPGVIPAPMPMFGPVSLEQVLYGSFEVHDSPPPGLRDIAGPHPQVAGPDPDINKWIKLEEERRRKAAAERAKAGAR